MRQHHRFNEHSTLAKTYMIYILVAPFVWDIMMEGIKTFESTFIINRNPLQILYAIILILGVYALNNKKKIMFSLFTAYNIVITANLLYFSIPSLIDNYGPNTINLASVDTWLIILTSSHSLLKSLIGLILLIKLLQEVEKPIRHIRSVS